MSRARNKQPNHKRRGRTENGLEICKIQDVFNAFSSPSRSSPNVSSGRVEKKTKKKKKKWIRKAIAAPHVEHSSEKVTLLPGKEE